MPDHALRGCTRTVSSRSLSMLPGGASFFERIERVRNEGHNWGWGVGHDMDDLMAEYEFAEE